MTTPAFSVTAGQQVSPQLNLNFVSASLDPRVTFTRAGATATRINSSGYIESVAANTARFDYSPVTLACLGLLIEEQRTNLITQSNNFSNAVWTKTGATVGSSATTSPFGSATSQKLVEDTSNGQHQLRQNFTSVNGTSYTLSFYAKAAERTWVACQLIGNITGFPFVYFDLQNGTTGTSNTSASNFSITPAGNGWYRCSLTGVANGTISAFFMWNAISNGNVSYQGVSGSGALFEAVQVEDGGSMTSYIPTTTTTVVRNADVAVMTGTNFSNWFNANQGTFRVDAISRAVGVRPLLSIDDNTSNNVQTVLTDSTAPKYIVTQSGVEQANVAAGTITANATMFAYVSYAANYFGIARPTARQVDTSGTVPSVDRLRIGATQAGVYANGRIQSIQYWP